MVPKAAQAGRTEAGESKAAQEKGEKEVTWFLAYIAIGFVVGACIGVVIFEAEGCLFSSLWSPVFFAFAWGPALLCWTVQEIAAWQNRRWVMRESKKLGIWK